MSDPTQPPVDPASSKPTDSSVPPAYETPAAPAYPAPGAPAAPAYGQASAYGQPPAYGQNPYGQQSPQDKYNVLSIISLVTSILGISIVGVITGHIGMSQIKKTGEKGRALALWGLILGYLGFALGLIGGIIIAAIVIGSATTGSTYYN
ncbi:MAG: DUF4190 domain-containing protein [Cryobacterium sp.]|uniref:DUF4190 domain-containing protein n=1 Tax=unclassified Cryobacterium TaxID=2649013 RepID=UPI0018CAACC7|nr:MULTISPECIES: DUF4190 domain-containing protein [unclassified Cryobacterium]MCY7405637.1 DUF4190 domain-containing protein [Cryobacterium sp.]MEC5153333.1 hypothetical protein [Cryobacterium sp. CAN_C3]